MLAMRHLYSARFPEAGIRAYNKRDRTNRRDTSKDKELGGRYLGGQGAVEDSPYTSTPCVPAPWLRPSAILVAVRALPRGWMSIKRNHPPLPTSRGPNCLAFPGHQSDRSSCADQPPKG